MKFLSTGLRTESCTAGTGCWCRHAVMPKSAQPKIKLNAARRKGLPIVTPVASGCRSVRITAAVAKRRRSNLKKRGAGGGQSYTFPQCGTAPPNHLMRRDSIGIRVVSYHDTITKSKMNHATHSTNRKCRCRQADHLQL